MRRSGIAVCLVAEFLKWRPDYVYQIGVGQWHKEVEVMQDAWPDVRLIGFEPHPVIWSRLKNYPGVVHNLAVTDKAGTAELHVPPRHKDGSSLCSINHADKTIPVNTTSLDAFYPAGPVGDRILLWLDCEGSELAVLRGAKKFLEKVQMVNVEMTGKPTSSDWPPVSAVHDELIGSGFIRQWIHTERINMAQIDAMYVREPLFSPVYCCCPCEVARCKK